jgi:hypothetical protein
LPRAAFKWGVRRWLAGKTAAKTLAARQMPVLLSAGNPEAIYAAPVWRPVGPPD